MGNSFGGDGGPNGQGYWVQDAADKIEVSPDGTVFAGVEWDEAGRCAGLYKDGKVNRKLLQEHYGRGRETAWGFGTANTAVAINGETLFLANTGKKLERFHWTPGDIDSATFVDETDLPGKAEGLNSRGDIVAVVYPTRVELRSVIDLAVTRTFSVKEGKDLAIAADRSLWLLTAGEIRHLSPAGEDLGDVVPGVAKPSAVAFDSQERLIVCDDGPDQQVKFFDASSTPKLLRTFGERGGLRSGTPGAANPKKLFSLRGAGADAAGNLYVAMSFGKGPAGNLHLRSFTPSGELRWQLMNNAFVDAFGFDPEADGRFVYSRNSVFDLDLAAAKPGAEAKLSAVTVDPVRHPDDPRTTDTSTAILRRIGGHRVLYTIGQYAGGFQIFTFEEPNSQIAVKVDEIHANDKWAWDVAANGDIWHGDADGRTIRRYACKGWTAEGKPEYDWKHPQSWPWPQDFQLVRRIIYDEPNDSLYLFGYLSGQKVDSWGVVGQSGRRYGGWLHGDSHVVWTNDSLPVNPTGSDDHRPLTPKAVALAGDYLFVGMVKPDGGVQYTHILSTKDASYVGSFRPGPEVGGLAGWQDMPYSVQALKRTNGEYLVLVEEDWRGINLLYRWTP